MESIADRCVGKRVLMVNAIRSDARSGGDTATRVLRERLRGATSLRVLDEAPRAAGPASTLAFVLGSFPAAAFVALGRASGWVSLEFLSRASIALLLRCLWARLTYRPDMVVFNHHATFPFSLVFPAGRVTLIWHDVPALKEGRNSQRRRDARCCAAVQASVLRHGVGSYTYSVTEQRFLRRAHAADVGLLAAIEPQPRAPRAPVELPAVLLMVGNWHREENRGGALSFFRAWPPSAGPLPSGATRIVVAGAGADAFLTDAMAQGVAPNGITAMDRYDDLSTFGACALVAPLLRGAGVKIKTLEAWRHGLPVLGTAQAFSGLSPAIASRGGLRFATVEALAAYCSTVFSDDPGFRRLEPGRAFEDYLSVTGAAPVRSPAP